MIETGLLQIQGEVLREQRMHQTQPPSQNRTLTAALPIGRSANVVRSQDASSGDGNDRDVMNCENSATGANTGTKLVSQEPDPRSDIARCFLRLSNLDNGVFERLGRYVMALWRQVRQTLFTLE